MRVGCVENEGARKKSDDEENLKKIDRGRTEVDRHEIRGREQMNAVMKRRE